MDKFESGSTICKSCLKTSHKPSILTQKALAQLQQQSPSIAPSDSASFLGSNRIFDKSDASLLRTPPPETEYEQDEVLVQEDHQEAPFVKDSADNGDCDGELVAAEVPKHGSNESLSSKVHNSNVN